MRSLVFGLVAISLLACAPKRAKTIDPDERARIEGTGLESRDIRAVAAQMTTDLLASPAVTQADKPPRIAVLPVKNRSRFLIDQEILRTLLTDQIVQGGAGKVRILNRDIADAIHREREAKRAGVLEAGEAKAVQGADYFLDGEVRGLSESTARAQADYLIVRFQLTDAESSEIVWSNSYEVKKQGSGGVIYQ